MTKIIVKSKIEDIEISIEEYLTTQDLHGKVDGVLTNITWWIIEMTNQLSRITKGKDIIT